MVLSFQFLVFGFRFWEGEVQIITKAERSKNIKLRFFLGKDWKTDILSLEKPKIAVDKRFMTLYTMSIMDFAYL